MEDFTDKFRESVKTAREQYEMEPDTEDGYDGRMDSECIPLCDALNRLPRVQTFASCCGHLKRGYSVWLRTDNLYSMAVIARALDKRYVPTCVVWEAVLETDDAVRTPQFCMCIRAADTHRTRESMLCDVDMLVKSLEYWSGPEFRDYFKYEKYCK